MKRLLIAAIGIVFVAGLLTACQSSSTDQHKEELDHAIHELQDEFATLYGLGPSASVSSIQKAAERIDASWDEIEAAAKHVEGVDLQEASKAHDAFAEAVKGLSKGSGASTATVDATATADGTPMSVVMPSLQEFRSAIEKMHDAGGFHHED